MSGLDDYLDLFYGGDNHVSGPLGSDECISTFLRDAIDGNDLRVDTILTAIQSFPQTPAGRFQRDALSLAADWFVDHCRLRVAQVDRLDYDRDYLQEEMIKIWQEYLAGTSFDFKFEKQSADELLAVKILLAFKYMVFKLETGDGDFEGRGDFWKHQIENNGPAMPAVRALRAFAKLLLDTSK